MERDLAAILELLGDLRGGLVATDAGQKLALWMGYIPAKPSIGSPSWLPEGTKINVMASDIAAVVKATEADKARFATMFGN